MHNKNTSTLLFSINDVCLRWLWITADYANCGRLCFSTTKNPGTSWYGIQVLKQKLKLRTTYLILWASFLQKTI